MTGPRPKVIVFDIDGVLLRLAPREVETFVGAFERCFGITEIDRDWNRYKKRNDIEIAKEILARHFGRAPAGPEIERVLDDYVAALAAGIAERRIEPAILPGAAETLQALTGRPGLCLALASANLRAAAELRLGRAGLWPRFHCGGFAEDGADKSAILRAVIAQCRRWAGRPIRPEEVLFLGDQPSDARAAKANLTGFIGVAADGGHRRDLEAAGADTIIPQLSIDALGLS